MFAKPRSRRINLEAILRPRPGRYYYVRYRTGADKKFVITLTLREARSTFFCLHPLLLSLEPRRRVRKSLLQLPGYHGGRRRHHGGQQSSDSPSHLEISRAQNLCTEALQIYACQMCQLCQLCHVPDADAQDCRGEGYSGLRIDVQASGRLASIDSKRCEMFAELVMTCDDC